MSFPGWRFLLQVSRPGLWFQTIWLYLIPTSQRPELLWSWRFWLGLVFVTYPLSLMVYGWNDVVDAPIDRLNPRKDSWFFGARGSLEQLRRLPPWIVAVVAPFVVAFLLLELRAGLAVAGMVVVNALYNLPRHGLRGMPPFELVNQLGYLLVLLFSITLNGVPLLPSATVAYLALFCTHAHLIGEIMDIEPDRASGRRTTATVLGARATKLLVVALVGFESAFLIWRFDELLLGLFLAAGVLWLLIDLVVFDPARGYSRAQYRLLGWGLNLSGFGSVVWLWMRGSLV
jgi:4-hydroxybenzoate polyprenyltransferase